jgi:RNA polymerase II subunit A C-terminal domain phosphatase SSU72
MVLRNSRIKDMPQRFQDNKDEFDIIITFEDRVFDIVCEGTGSSNHLIARFAFGVSVAEIYTSLIFFAIS